MSDWKRHHAAVGEAVARGDFAAAEAHLAEMWALARAHDDEQVICNTHFKEGVLRDAQGRHADALAAFEAALAIDERLHGPRSTAVADVCHSLGLVRVKQGDLEGALAAYRREADILAAAQPFRLASARTRVGDVLLRLRRLPEARAEMEQAVAAAEAAPLTPEHNRASAHRGFAQALQASGEVHGALSQFLRALRFSRPKMWPELREVLAGAWFLLGQLSERAFQGTRFQAALAYDFAARLGRPELRRIAEARLAALPEHAQVARGEPDTWRVVYVDPRRGISHLANIERGLFVYREPIEGVGLGDAVEAVLGDGAIASARRRPDA